MLGQHLEFGTPCGAGHFTETAWLADVICLHLHGLKKMEPLRIRIEWYKGRKAIEPPGDAKEDLWIIQELARGLGLNGIMRVKLWC